MNSGIMKRFCTVGMVLLAVFFCSWSGTASAGALDSFAGLEGDD